MRPVTGDLMAPHVGPVSDRGVQRSPTALTLVIAPVSHISRVHESAPHVCFEALHAIVRHAALTNVDAVQTESEVRFRTAGTAVPPSTASQQVTAHRPLGVLLPWPLANRGRACSRVGSALCEGVWFSFYGGGGCCLSQDRQYSRSPSADCSVHG